MEIFGLQANSLKNKKIGCNRRRKVSLVTTVKKNIGQHTEHVIFHSGSDKSNEKKIS